MDNPSSSYRTHHQDPFSGRAPSGRTIGVADDPADRARISVTAALDSQNRLSATLPPGTTAASFLARAQAPSQFSQTLPAFFVVPEQLMSQATAVGATPPTLQSLNGLVTLPASTVYPEELLAWSERFSSPTALPYRPTLTPQQQAGAQRVSTASPPHYDLSQNPSIDGGSGLSVDFSALAMRSLDASSRAPLLQAQDLQRSASTGFLANWPPGYSVAPSLTIAQVGSMDSNPELSIDESSYNYNPSLFGFNPFNASSGLQRTDAPSAMRDSDDTLLDPMEIQNKGGDLINATKVRRTSSGEDTISGSSPPNAAFRRHSKKASTSSPLSTQTKSLKTSPTNETNNTVNPSASGRFLLSAAETIPPKLFASTARTMFHKDVSELTPKEKEACVNSVLSRRARNTASARRSRVKRIEEMQEMEDAMRTLEEENQALKDRVLALEARLAEVTGGVNVNKESQDFQQQFPPVLAM